jgi:Ca-activated chloride channel family protein
MMPSFAHPWLLILLPLVLWLGWRLRSGAPAAFSRPPITLRHPILARLHLAQTQSAGSTRAWLAPVAALIVLAAAQPQTQGGWLPPIGEGRDILLLIDTSPSMAIQDMTLDNKSVPRMDVLKHAAQGFIDAREHDRLGMIVFSDHAATAIPLTNDRAAVQAQLARLTPGNTGAATAIGEGLGVALRQIEANKERPPVIVLFSDGDNTGGILRPREALAYAERLGLHLYSIAVTPDTAPPAAQSDGLREPSLMEMSELTGGRAYQASDEHSLRDILADINQREATPTPPPSERIKIDWYPLPLGLALLILALGQWTELRSGRAPT